MYMSDNSEIKNNIDAKSLVCIHRSQLDKYKDENKLISYNVKVKLDNKTITTPLMDVSFYNYLLFTDGKLKIPSGSKIWLSEPALVFESKLSFSDMEVVHNNLEDIFNNKELILKIIGVIKNLIHSAGDNRMTKLSEQYVKSLIDVIFTIEDVVNNFRSMNMKTQYIKILLKNLLAFLFCSHVYIPPYIKNDFCEYYPSLFDKIWNAETYIERIFENLTKKKWCHC
jgi:hypothetical protein